MKKVLTLAILIAVVFGVSTVRSETFNLDLLYAVVSGTEPKYDNAEHYSINTSLRVWMSKGGKAISIYVLSCYVNTGDNDTRHHEQKVDLVSPSGERIVATATNPIDLLTVQDKNLAFQRAYVSAKLDIPALDTTKPENFGVYTIKIYLDGDLIKKYPYPILAR